MSSRTPGLRFPESLEWFWCCFWPIVRKETEGIVGLGGRGKLFFSLQQQGLEELLQ